MIIEINGRRIKKHLIDHYEWYLGITIGAAYGYWLKGYGADRVTDGVIYATETTWETLRANVGEAITVSTPDFGSFAIKAVE